MAILRKNGMEAEVTLAELRALFGVPETDSAPAKTRAASEPRSKATKAADAVPTVAKPQAAMNAYAQQSTKGKKLAELLIERGESGVLQQDLVDLLEVTPPQVSRLIGSWREAALSAGLKEAAFVRFNKEGRGKRWFATNLLSSALTISPRNAIPEPAEDGA